MSSATKKSLIDGLQRLQKQTDFLITRNFYRVHGGFKEAEWQAHFPTFNHFREAAGLNPDKIPTAKADETSEIAGDTWTISMPRTRINSLEELLEHAKVDLAIWEVERCTINQWEMISKAHGVEPLFQVKAILKKRTAITAIRAEIESLKNEAKAVARVPKAIVRHTKSSGNLLELMIPDLHAGKLCWSKETGYQDYDTAIALDTYRRSVDHLLELASGYTFDKIILGVGNDLLQSDNIQGTTYSGTKVDTDTRFHKTYRLVREMLTETIEKLRLIAPVEVKMVPGNHDTLSTFTLGDSLECRFVNYPDVVVDNAPTMEKTVEWGNCFLLLTHGHQGKQTDYAAWMASRFPQEFGRTKFREVHVGHKHKSALDEKFGIRTRTLSSLTLPDAWHANNNFVGNLRVAEGLVFNKEHGLVAQFYHTEAD